MNHSDRNFRIFLCGDVMTGRGIDQILLHPSKPQLYESFITDARDYVLLTQQANGKINYPVAVDYIWGDALAIWQQYQPDIKIINLETAITESDDYWPHKAVNYRMHPRNIDVLTAAGIDICVLANNHTLDWGYPGLRETLATLKNAGILFSGAGTNIVQAIEPAIFNLAVNRRVLVFSIGMASSGVPPTWAATAMSPGIYYLSSENHKQLASISENIKKHRQLGDLVIFSIHWGSNWGYEIPEAFRFLAHELIDNAKIDVVFGHSSHHPRAIEIFQNKPIFYGCGDFINDYEGISGYETYRSDLTFMYFLDFDRESLKLNTMTLVPMQIKKLSLQRANEEDSRWLLHRLNNSRYLMPSFIDYDQSFVLSNPHRNDY